MSANTIKPNGEATSKLPQSFGMLLFPAFEPLDAFGPLEVLQILSKQRRVDLSLISTTMDPVSTAPRAPHMNPMSSNFCQKVLPTHTLEEAPPLDVLIVPGGLGTRAPDLQAHIDWIGNTYPTVQHLITICSGSGLVARTGVLDNVKATTSKFSWADIVKDGPKVQWLRHARFTVDGNIWTSSGISSGIDVTLHFVHHMYGSDVAQDIADRMEYVWNKDPSNDPFDERWPLRKT